MPGDYLLFKGVLQVTEEASKTLELKITMKSFLGDKLLLLIVSDTSQRILVKNLKQTIEYKNRLLASVSHELRTPLNGNINFLDAAIEDNKVPSAIKEKFLIPALRCAKHLLNVISDILDFSQMQAE